MKKINERIILKSKWHDSCQILQDRTQNELDLDILKANFISV